MVMDEILSFIETEKFWIIFGFILGFFGMIIGIIVGKKQDFNGLIALLGGGPFQAFISAICYLIAWLTGKDVISFMMICNMICFFSIFLWTYYS